MLVKNITMSIVQARTLYKTTSDPAFRALIEANFTEKELSEEITDVVTDWKSALDVLRKQGTTRYSNGNTGTPLPTKQSEWAVNGYIPSTASEADQLSVVALSKLLTLAHVLNEGWVPDWSNQSTNKWKVSINSMGTLVVSCNSSCIESPVYFKSKEIALHVRKHNEQLFKQLYRVK